MTDDIETGSLAPEILDAFLAQPLIARIATASPSTHRPHVVPVWFEWDGESIWISTFRSTRKIRELQANPLCSIAIDSADSGVDFRGVVFEGPAELVTAPLDFVQRKSEQIYTRYLGEEVRQPRYQEWIYDSENLLIKLTPQRRNTWYFARKYIQK
jgi:nitroimidazol reductase NimA-like FMN-containing flavoprotein (pyridoxamine 5'-phosphate oxidase superfamily)